MDTEQRLEKVERQNRNQRMALMLLTVVLCGVVTMAATGENVPAEYGQFDFVVVKHMFVLNEAGGFVVRLGATDDGHGLVKTLSASGKDLVKLSTTTDGNGTVTPYSSSGKQLVDVGADTDGGALVISNKEGDAIIQAIPLFPGVIIAFGHDYRSCVREALPVDLHASGGVSDSREP